MFTPLKAPAWWYRAEIPAAAYLLSPLAALYGKAVERRFARSEPYRAEIPVICIGNFTMGGAGKTPVAIKLAGLLRERGLVPGFLTRGYGGSEKGPHRVTAADTAVTVGDEALLLAEHAPTVVSRDRPRGARMLAAEGASVIIMDDGFQNPSLAKDFSLIVVDGGAGVGCGRVFPLGPLRAELSFQVAMAHAVVFIGEEAAQSAALRGSLAGVSVFKARIRPRADQQPPANPVLAYTGIGRPQKFYESLADAGVTVSATESFADHHVFRDEDARRLLDRARKLSLDLVTTEKDYARLRGSSSGILAELREQSLPFGIEVIFDGDSEAKLVRMIEQIALTALPKTGTVDAALP